MAKLKKLFNKKPGCFGKYNGSWTMCRDQCNFNKECFQESTGVKVTPKKRPDWHKKVYGAGGGSSRKSKADSWTDDDADRHFRAKWGIEEKPKFKKEPTKRPPKTTYGKPKPQRRVFHMPSGPRTRMVFGSMGDINMATMFGLYKYGEDVLRMVPSDIAEEYDRLQLEPDILLKDQRITKLKDAVRNHWSSWDEFIVFMNT